MEESPRWREIREVNVPRGVKVLHRVQKKLTKTKRCLQESQEKSSGLSIPSWQLPFPSLLLPPSLLAPANLRFLVPSSSSPPITSHPSSRLSAHRTSFVTFLISSNSSKFSFF